MFSERPLRTMSLVVFEILPGLADKAFSIEPQTILLSQPIART